MQHMDNERERFWTSQKGVRWGAVAVVLFAITALPCGHFVRAATATRAVSVTITDAGFVPNHIDSRLDKKLTLRVSNRGHLVHEFAIPGYHIYTQNLAPGASTTVGFTPDRRGQFEIMSDPSGNDAPEFSGKLTITNAK